MAAESAQAGADAENGRSMRSTWLSDLLRERIVAGRYQPGERIREADLRAEFGFSNGPIREALQAIVADGLAERNPWQGIRIRTLGPDQILALFQVRTALLEYAAELAARRCTRETMESAVPLKSSLDEAFESLRTEEGHPSFDGRLSRWLLEAADNDALREVWRKTMLQTLFYVRVSLLKSRGVESRKLIFELIDHICARQPSEARATARQLTQQTLADLGIAGDV